MNTILLAFITGLTTGGISCLTVQSGLLATALTDKNQNRKITVLSFLAAKIAAYTILGFLLGIAGSKLTLTPQVQGWMQIFAGLYMLTAAANLVDLHPIFRHFVITPPKFLFRILRKQSKVANYFTPLFLGASTILVPCGITQGMIILAISTANPFWAAAIMFAFTLGTSPVFAGIGIGAASLLTNKKFRFIGALVITILAIISINTGQILRGSFHTLQNYGKVLTEVPGNKESSKEAPITSEGKQELTIDVNSFGYKASANTIKAGVPVKINLVTNNTQGCSRAFTIPALKISKVLPETGNETLEFTPTKKGILTYTCSMGMYTGRFNVI